MRKHIFATAIAGVVALAASILAFPAAAQAANPDAISTPTRIICLQPENRTHGAQVVQAACNGSPDQRWFKDGFQFVNAGSGFCLSAGGPVQPGRTLVATFTCNQSGAGRWLPGSSVPGVPTTLIFRSPGVPDRCVEIPGGFEGIGNGVWLSRCSGSASQLWLLPG